MSLSVHLSGRSNIVIEPVSASKVLGPMILLTLEGQLHGEALNCALVPVSKVPELVETLRLAAGLAQP